MKTPTRRATVFAITAAAVIGLALLRAGDSPLMKPAQVTQGLEAPPKPDESAEGSSAERTAEIRRATGLAQRSPLLADRLTTIQATNALDALAAANRLPLDDPDRTIVTGLVAGLCRRVEISDEPTRFATLVRNGIIIDTTENRRVHARQFSATQRYCTGVSGLALLASQDRDRGAVESSPPESDGNDYHFVNAIANDPSVMEVGFAAAVRAMDASQRLWKIVDNSDSPMLTSIASQHLALAGAPGFPDAGSVIGRGGGNDLVGTIEQRAEIVRTSAATLFWCRTYSGCGAHSLMGLREPWVSDLSASMGVEGTLRSTLSPVQWQAVESIYEQLRQRREAAQRG